MLFLLHKVADTLIRLVIRSCWKTSSASFEVIKWNQSISILPILTRNLAKVTTFKQKKHHFKALELQHKIDTAAEPIKEPLLKTLEDYIEDNPCDDSYDYIDAKIKEADHV